MDITFNVLLIIHLMALAVGTAGAVAMPIIMPRMAAAGPEGRQLLGGVAGRLRANAQIAFGVLLISGIAMVFVRYGGVAGMSVWFWIKMGLIGLMLAVMIASGLLKPGTLSPALVGWVTRLSLIGIFVSAVFAFN